MFLTYLRRELRRRLRQAVVISLGLALGVGLVITVTAAASGAQNAEGTVLHSLYGVGTDVTVTKAAAAGSGGSAKFEIKQQLKSTFGGQRPPTGTRFSRNLLTSSASGLGTLGSASVTSIARLPHVSAASGALNLADLTLSGTIPAPRSQSTGGTRTSSISSNSFSVLGVDTATGRTGPLSSAKLTLGRAFTSADSSASVALVDANYAAQNKLAPGSEVTVGNGQGTGTTFRVVGVVRAPPGAIPADVYIPLPRAQALGAAAQGGGTLAGQVNTIYVAADSAADIGTVQHEISALLPTASVSTSSDLASLITGSLATTSTLAGNLGTWLEAAVLAAAFGVASLLTMAAVTRRVREFGTLKALGWRTRRVVAQLMGETVAMGIAGGLLGAALGFAGADLVARLAPPLTATVGQALGSAAPGGKGGGGGILHGLSGTAAPTVSVHLTTPVTAAVVAAAVLLAVAGGLIAGGLGGWRVARLRPAAALARVE